MTIRGLAKKAGVSPATVSLALRNHPRISKAMRERIQRLAKKEGYVPNPIVSKLIAQVRASKTTLYKSTIAIVNTSEHVSDTEEPTVKSWTEAAAARAKQLGYFVDHFVTSKEHLRPERLIDILDARGIQGLIVTGPFHNNIIDPKLDALWARSVAVVLGERPVRPALSCVINNQFNTVIQAMREAGKLGYARPGLCVHPDIDVLLEQRLSGGYLVGQQALPAKARLPMVDYRPEDRTAFARWFEKHRPDVILTLHTEVRDWLAGMGVKVPTDCGLIHLDLPPGASDWAGMWQNHEHASTAAVDMLTGQLYRNEIGPPRFQKCMVINSEWRTGKTVTKA